MGHYDCSACGAHLGIDYGICEACTPSTVLELERQLASERAKAHARYQLIRPQEELDYVNQQTAMLSRKYKAELNKWRPKK